MPQAPDRIGDALCAAYALGAAQLGPDTAFLPHRPVLRQPRIKDRYCQAQRWDVQHRARCRPGSLGFVFALDAGAEFDLSARLMHDRNREEEAAGNRP